jgi:hypothetical protein
MTNITEDALCALLCDIQNTTPEDYQAQLKAEARRVVPPGMDGPTITRPCPTELERAKRLLEKHGYTVVPTDRIVTVDVAHKFSHIEVLSFDPKELDRIAEHVLGSLSAQLGGEIAEKGAATKHDITEFKTVPVRTVGWSATLILPEKAGG